MLCGAAKNERTINRSIKKVEKYYVGSFFRHNDYKGYDNNNNVGNHDL
jgi:hypothetical protein